MLRFCGMRCILNKIAANVNLSAILLSILKKAANVIEFISLLINISITPHLVV